MRQSNTLFSFFLFLNVLACQEPHTTDQGETVPTAVVNRLMLNYPLAEKIEWNRDRNNSFEAEFEIGKKKLRADFNPDGTWIETEESIKWKDLPAAVQEAIKRDYDKDDIVELEHTINAKKGEFWDVELDPKGRKKFDVEYRKDGSVRGME